MPSIVEGAGVPAKGGYVCSTLEGERDGYQAGFGTQRVPMG